MDTLTQNAHPPASLSSLKSRGSQTKKAANLGGLHAKRQEHLSQFFTPQHVVDFCWSLVQPAMHEGKRYRVLDNSCGAGAWFANARADQHELVGLDLDAELIAHVQMAFESSDFNVELVAGDLAEARLPKCSVAFINPPFSINLASPAMVAYKGVTSFGKFGADTSANSHEYALAQALSAADIVCALVPSSVTAKLKSFGSATKGRLRAVLSLPKDTFRDENVANVATDILIFGRYSSRDDVFEADYSPSLAVPDLGLYCRDVSELGDSRIRLAGQDTNAAVTTPVTGDSRVRMTRKGRQIRLRFFDGLTEARVLNRIYRKRLQSTREWRYPECVKYSGQYRLSLDVLLMQDNPIAEFNALLDDIRSWGGVPDVQTELWAAFRSLGREHTLMSAPFGLTVFQDGASAFSAEAKRTGLLNHAELGAVVKKGETVSAVSDGEGYLVTTDRGTFKASHDKFTELFDAVGNDTDQGEWTEVHPPLRQVFPQQIADIERRIKQVPTIDSLSWDFQYEDVLELALKPKGAVIALEMALGKTRVEITLGLYFSGASLLVVKSRLVDELLIELEGLGVDPSLYQVIASPSDARNLRSLNIISYNKLRSLVHPSTPKLTYAKMLKRRVKTLLADEGGMMSNVDSLQSKAVRQVGAKRVYLLDGTPSSNYPREFLPLLAAVAGEEKSYQPFSLDGTYLEPRFINSCGHAEVGRKAFMDRFTVMKWATNEFVVDGHGAKREVPKVPSKNLGAFRSLLAPLVKRRTQQEPAVKACVSFPVPTINPVTSVEWDADHFEVYQTVCREFSAWYMNYKAQCEMERKKLSLVVILARLEACFKAANVPTELDCIGGPYNAMTSKERAVIERLADQVAAGHRPLMFARSPVTVNRIYNALRDRGLDFLVYTGQETIKSRSASLQERVRGESCVDGMLATLGVAQDGLNLEVLDRVVFYNRDWKFRAEYQGIFRLLRAANKCEIEVDYFHLGGSIDDYMGQLNDWKGASFASSLDYGVSGSEDDFHHFDAMLGRFLKSIEENKPQPAQAA